MGQKNNKSVLILCIIGIMVFILITIGMTYAYFTISSANNNDIGGNTGGVSLSLIVTRISTNTANNLVPIDNDLTTLGKAILGYNNDSGAFDANKACVDKNGNASCQIYQVNITNSSGTALNLSGGVTNLSGASVPNIACAIMPNSISITSNATCIGNTTFANNVSFNKNETKTYYMLVYINNLNNNQTDSGSFSGTVEFTTAGANVTANFG